MGPVPPAESTEPAEFSFSMAYSSPRPLSPSSPTPLPSSSRQIPAQSETTPSSGAGRPVPLLQSLHHPSSRGAPASGPEQESGGVKQELSSPNASAGPESIGAKILGAEDAGPGTSVAPVQEPGPSGTELPQLGTSPSGQRNAGSLGESEGNSRGPTEVEAGVSGTQAGPGATTRAPTIRKKVPYEKGFSQMDWLKLTQTHPDLAGLKGGPKRRITMEEVKLHKAEDDSWTVLRGKVFNITPYFNFHPGGKKMLKLAAGKDCTELFNKYHMWVNAEFLLEKCWLGILDNDQGH